MKITIRELKEDDELLDAKAGDLLLVDLQYDWDPEKVIVMAVLKRGSDPSCSAYKSSLKKPTEQYIQKYLSGDL